MATGMITPKLTKKQRASLCPSEHQEQAMLFDWALNKSPMAIRHLTRLLYAIPNESKTGNRDKLGGIIRGKRLKAEGRRKGFPDTCLPVARGTFHSLYIEMKRSGEAFEEPNAEQKAWHVALFRQRHCVIVANGAQNAIDEIEAYLTLLADPETGMIATDLDYGAKP